MENTIPGTTAYRIVHSDADGFDGLTVDRLGPALLVEVHKPNTEADGLISFLRTEYGEETPIFFKDKRSSSKDARTGIQVAGRHQSPRFTVCESGLDFEVQLTNRSHIGIFLDSRAVRRKVREVAEGRRVLNLFSYTGGFGMAAAAGRARSTTNIDAKRSALEAAERNYDLNGLDHDSRTFLKSDAVAFLKKVKKKGWLYDLVILDPPPLSKRTNRDVLDTKSAFSRLVARSVEIVSDDGLVIAGLNNRLVSDSDFERMISEGLNIAGRVSSRREVIEIDADFPSFSGRPTARFVAIRVG